MFIEQVEDMVQYKTVPYPNSEVRTHLVRNEQPKIKKAYMQYIQQCEDCGCSIKDILEIHHIVPVRYGGGNDTKNLKLLCPNCHKLADRRLDDNILQNFVSKRQDLGNGIKCILSRDRKVRYYDEDKTYTFSKLSSGEWYLEGERKNEE